MPEVTITEDTFAETLQRFDHIPEIVLDCETTGLQPYSGDRLIGTALCDPKDLNNAAYFPFRHMGEFSEEGGNLSLGTFKKFIDAIRRWRKRPGHTEIGQNYKFDMQFLMVEGLDIPPKIEDSLLLAHLMNENEVRGKTGYKLEDLSEKYVEKGAARFEDELLAYLAEAGFKNKNAKAFMQHLPGHIVGPYAAQDVRLTAKLRDFYWPKMDFWKIRPLAYEMFDYSRTLTRIEARGMRIDPERLEQLADRSEMMRAQTLQEFRDMTGVDDLNPRSYKKVANLMGVASTDAKYLAVVERAGRLKPNQLAMVRKLQEFRSWDRTIIAYYEPYKRTMDANNIIHPNFKMTTVVTGRLSMGDPSPNLMAIPITADEDPAMSHVKECFIARDGYVLLNMDESQAELRLLAHYAVEPLLKQWLEEGRDIHSETQALLRSLGINVIRDHAKRINFGISYGLGEKGLSEQTGLSREDSRTVLRGYHSQFPGIKRLMNKAETAANENGFVRLWTGRPRRFNDRYQDPHKAMSNIIQGGVAELIRRAMTRLDPIYQRLGSHMTLQVHDNIMAEVPFDRDAILETWAESKAVMEDSPFNVKLRADSEIGFRWAECKKVKTREDIEEWLLSQS